MIVVYAGKLLQVLKVVLQNVKDLPVINLSIFVNQQIPKTSHPLYTGQQFL